MHNSHKALHAALFCRHEIENVSHRGCNMNGDMDMSKTSYQKYIMSSHKALQAELFIRPGPGFCHRKCIVGTFTISLADRVDI